MNADQFRSLYDQTARDLLGYLLRRTSNPEDAADCLAETFLIAWNKREEFPPGGEQARPWLFGVARNTVRRDREAKRKASTATLELARELTQSRAAAPDSAPVTLALAELSPLDREIIEMLAWDQLTPRDVAAILDLTPNVVRIRAHRARLKLREHLEANTTAVAELALTLRSHVEFPHGVCGNSTRNIGRTANGDAVTTPGGRRRPRPGRS